MKKLFVILLFFIPGQLILAQVYMPRDVQKAYTNGTRSMDGKPGKNYWQNKGTYDITITANPPDRNIKGIETINYTNNSPDTLRVLIIKLYLNIHQPGGARQGSAGKDYLTDGIMIDSFKENDEPGKFPTNSSRTFEVVRLKKPLAPNQSVKLNFDWHYQISLESGREGMIDSTTYYFAYFYPRVAVYDDYNGWDVTPFTDAQEFYNDFNDYDLKINVPKNYFVWSTGDLQNTDEVLQPEAAAKLKKSMTSDEVIRIATPENIKAKNVTAQNAMNTWRFTSSHITDVAFGISDHYNWDAGSVLVDPVSKRRSSVQSAYNDDAQDFHSMVNFGKHALNWFSLNWPGVAYPFPKTSIFQGFADMEYPMMVNDASTKDTIFSRFVAEHEIAHSWFPFYMGINETRYGFMDEGWATTLEYLIGTNDLGKEKADDFFKQFRVTGWIQNGSPGQDLPIITPGDFLSGAPLGSNQYGKPALGYLAMKDMLGDDLFKKCLHAYMDRWHGKHPIPWDFFNTFNNVSKMDLNWFWNSWFNSNGYIDFKLADVKSAKAGYDIVVENIGGFPAPFDLNIDLADGSKEVKHLTSALWSTGQKSVSIHIPTTKKIKSVTIDGGIFMDATPANNRWQ